MRDEPQNNQMLRPGAAQATSARARSETAALQLISVLDGRTLSGPLFISLGLVGERI